MNPLRVLFIGNSFTNRNDLPGTIARLAAAAHPPRRLESERIIANGMSLKTHWDRGIAREAIAAERWDHVVLQEQSTLPLKNPKRMHESVTMFDEQIRKQGARTVLYMTWARLSSFERQDELTDAYVTVGKKLGAVVVPVGVAWKKVLAEHPQIVLHDRDGSHPNAVGSYVAACVFVASLFGINPVGLLADRPGLAKLEASELEWIQQIAWDAARSFIRSPERAAREDRSRQDSNLRPAD